jgi:hypothetical protein
VEDARRRRFEIVGCTCSLQGRMSRRFLQLYGVDGSMWGSLMVLGVVRARPRNAVRSGCYLGVLARVSRSPSVMSRMKNMSRGSSVAWPKLAVRDRERAAGLLLPEAPDPN